MTVPLLQVPRLTKNFGGLRAVNSVDHELQSTGLYAIIGPNEAGKTTFFNLITGIIPSDEGEVLFNGQNILGKAPHKISRMGISRTLQVKSVFNGLTVYENVWIAAHAGKRFLHPFRSAASFVDTDQEVRAILSEFGLIDIAHDLAGNLSYGDLALLEMGISLATKPLLLLDERVAGMSPEETKRTVDKIKQLSATLPIILIEHDMEMVFGAADEITVMHQGAVICRGAPDFVSKDAGVQEAYLGVPQGAEHA